MKSIKASKTVWVTFSILAAIIGFQSWVIFANNGQESGKEQNTTIPVTVQNDADNNAANTPSKDPFGLWTDDELFQQDPFEEMERMHDHMRKMMELAMSDMDKNSWFGSNDRFSAQPKVNLEDKGAFYSISIEIPGENQPQVKTELSGNKMFITSIQDQTEENKDDENGHYSRSSRKQQYSQVIQFPEMVDPKTLESHFEESVLILEIKKLEK